MSKYRTSRRKLKAVPPPAPAAALPSRVRRLRLERGLRLQDVARRAGFTTGFLSKIENGKSSPPIASLLRVADALGVDVAALLGPSNGAPPDATCHTPAKARRDVTNTAAGPGYSYQALATARTHKLMEPFLITVSPREVDPKRRFQHPGEEFIFMVKGTMDYLVGEEVFSLRPGDSLYFDASRPHAPLAKGGPARFLAMFIAPPKNRGEMTDDHHEESVATP